MAVSDIFSSSFLFSIAIIIITIGGIFAYVSYRMGEQDKKLNAMIGLITTMAEESQFFRGKLNALQQKMNNDNDNDIIKDETNKLVPILSQEGGGLEENLIDVSDDEDEDEDDVDDEDDDDDNDDEDDDDVDDEDAEDDVDDDEDDIDDEEGNPSDTIKLLNLSLASGNSNYEDEDIHDVLNIENVSFENDNNITKMVHLQQNILLDEDNVENIGDLNEYKHTDITTELKNIAINADLDLEEELDKTDYKKMSLNKLRELVVSKGLINDAGKLKKNEIVKMLENHHHTF